MTPMSDATSFAEIEAIIAALPAFDAAAAEAATARQNTLTKPPGSLGQLEEIAAFIAGWRGTARPVIDTAQAVVFAGNHGVCAQGVNPFPQEVTVQMVANFEAGGAAINQLCRVAGADLSVVALELDRPTGDISTTVAMSEADTVAAMVAGARAVDPHADILLLGEMGIGNSTIAAAMAMACFGGEAADWVGRGTGSDAHGIAHKAEVVARAVDLHKDTAGLARLAAVGGREQAAICGAVLAARQARVPVLIDGYICTAAVAPLFAMDAGTLAHCLVGHTSAEPGHRKILTAMGKSAVLDFRMALGEGSGAALALNIVRAALECHNGMATFAEAGVSDA